MLLSKGFSIGLTLGAKLTSTVNRLFSVPCECTADATLNKLQGEFLALRAKPVETEASVITFTAGVILAYLIFSLALKFHSLPQVIGHPVTLPIFNDAGTSLGQAPLTVGPRTHLQVR